MNDIYIFYITYVYILYNVVAISVKTKIKTIKTTSICMRLIARWILESGPGGHQHKQKQQKGKQTTCWSVGFENYSIWFV